MSRTLAYSKRESGARKGKKVENKIQKKDQKRTKHRQSASVKPGRHINGRFRGVTVGLTAGIALTDGMMMVRVRRDMVTRVRGCICLLIVVGIDGSSDGFG